MVSACVTLAALPIHVGCAAVCLSSIAANGVFTAANGALTAANGTLVAINGAYTIIYLTTQGAWTLTKLTYYGTKKVFEIATLPLEFIASIFSKKNQLLTQQNIYFQQVITLENDVEFNEWMKDAVQLMQPRELSQEEI